MKYLWQSTSKNITTGYGVLSNNVVEGLIKKGVDIRLFGMQTLGHQKEEWNLPVLDDIYGADAIQFYSKLYGIDYLISVIDHFVPVYHYLPGLLKSLKVGHIAHVTVNSLPLPPMLYNQIKDADFFVAPSKFAEKALIGAGIDKNKIRQIPHGVNTTIFKPLKEETEKHKKMMGYQNKFVWLTVSTNTGTEKNWQGLFYAYKIFLVNNPEAKKDTLLHCHTSIHYPSGYDLELLAKMYGIFDNISFITGFSLNVGTPPEEMVKLYNVADCYLSATMGESFGLPALESMACGTPCIIPNHTTGPELVGEPKTGLLIEPLKMKNGQEFGWTGPTISDKWLIDPVDMADKMTKIYKDKKLREEFSKTAVEFAQNFDWEKHIIPQWIDFLNYVESYIEPVNYEEKKLGI